MDIIAVAVLMFNHTTEQAQTLQDMTITATKATTIHIQGGMERSGRVRW